jgi:hypothetical protein
MIRNTLCTPPDGWDDQVKRLAGDGLQRDAARTLLTVELCLGLIEYLERRDETVAVVPALLSGLPFHGVEWTREQARAIANVRQIAVGYGSATAWRNALETYAVLPEAFRRYRFPDQPVPEDGDESPPAPRRITPSEWMVELLGVATEYDYFAPHEDLYQRALTKSLPYRQRRVEWAQAGGTYRFSANVSEGGGRQPYVVTLPEQLPMIGPAPWFDGLPPRSRVPIVVRLREDLEPIARRLDDADEQAGHPSKNWVKRLATVRYRPLSANGEPDESAPDVITLDGFTHAAGMVASGKSTLAFLLAAWVICCRPDLRICLVVGDVQSSLRIVDDLNTYFCGDIESDAPAATPLLGRSSRDKHLRDLHGSREYREKRDSGAGHWGERFLSVACPLQALVRETVEKPLPPGSEPCGNLRPLPRPRRGGRAADDPELPTEKRLLCPLYAGCPVQQVYRDMTAARVWVTNPWAMTYGSLPRQVEPRPVRIGEIVYEQCDAVLFDEADALMGVFDEVFAEVAQLTNGRDGIYDRVGVQTETFAVRRRGDAGAHRMRWSAAQRNGQTATMNLLSLLSDPETAFLRRWLERTQFTPHSLMLRVARMASGLSDFALKGEDDIARAENAFEPFRLLFEQGGDPLRQQRLAPVSPVRAEARAYHLWRLLVDISSGADVFSDGLLRGAEAWLQETYPDIQKNLDVLNARRRAASEDAGEETTRKSKRAKGGAGRGAAPQGNGFENLRRVAYRLVFALCAALLDRNTEVVLYEWHSRAAPDEEDGDPHRRMPAVLTDILPLPPVGRQFGTYFAPGDGSSSERRSANVLQYLSYTNIGRWYLLNFHRLRSDLDGGVAGPHVLALSGTSYLPDSVRLHVGTRKQKPQGLLLPEEAAECAIRDSKFFFLPLASRAADRKPIRISGVKEWDKPAALADIATALAGTGDSGKLGAEIAALVKLGESDPAKWADRARLLLLVNSYDQAKIIADTLRREWRTEAARIYHLSRIAPNREGDELIGGGAAATTLRSGESGKDLRRTDIETFARTGGRVLVAPISAIGRGFNILNFRTPPIAAFGTVYFLVRPYPHPDDMTALARELNRRTLDWAEWEEFAAWSAPSLESQFATLRRTANDYWHDMERRKYWSTLHDRPSWLCEPKKDLAAFTAGVIVQAAGRLLRGGVPFRAYFCDAAFAPRAAHRHCVASEDSSMSEPDAPADSLLAAVVELLRESVAQDTVAKALYAPLADALCDLRVGSEPDDYSFDSGAHWQKPKKHKKRGES